MGLNTKLAPDSMNGRMTYAQMFGQSVAAPMSSSVTGPFARCFQDFGFQLCGAYPPLTASVARIQPLEPLLLEAPLPDTDIAISAVEPTANLRKTQSLSDQQH